MGMRLDLQPTTTLFVYGSLLKGEAYHTLIEQGDWLGEDALEGSQLFNLGPYPMLLLSATGTVWGECYQILAAMIPDLDEFEDHPTIYQRQWLQLRSGRQAWVYVGQPQFTVGFPQIVTGRWQDR